MREKVKNLMLLLLLVSAVLLLLISLTMGIYGSDGVNFSELLSRASGKDKTDAVDTQNKISTPFIAVLPEKLAISRESGVYVTYWGEELDAGNKALAPIFNEAIGSAHGMTEITKAKYLSMLTPPAALICYDTALDFYMLQAWSESEYTDVDATVTRLLLTVDQSAVKLAFFDKQTQKYYAATTAAEVTHFTEACVGDKSNGVFAYADSRFKALPPDEPVVLGEIVLPTWEQTPPAYAEPCELPREVLQAFYFNDYLTHVYEETQGARVYIEGYKALKVTTDGNLLFSGTAGEGIPLGISAPGIKEEKVQMIEQVCGIIDNIWRSIGASGTISMDGYEQKPDGSVILRFSLQQNGIFVWQETSAVYVEANNNYITTIAMEPRIWTQGIDMQVLPYAQGVATLPPLAQNKNLSVRYVQDGSRLTPKLCTVGGQR